MLSISVTSNAKQIAKDFDSFRDQIPFATALALTRTAQGTQAKLRGGLDEHFTVRGNWVRNSLRYTPAQKADLVATVGSVYEPMALQVDGGQKTGKNGKVAAPVWARREKSKVTRPAQWPSKLLTRSNFFVRDGAIFQRMGRGGRGGLRLWWVLKEQVEIKARWPFEAETNEVVRRTFADHFIAAMHRAIATKR